MTWLNPWHLSRAAEAIHGGGVIAYATEAVFGLGCDPADEAALAHLLALKVRPPEKGLILIAADVGQLAAYIEPFDAETWARIAPTWPGPNTWVVPAKASLSRLVTGNRDTVAVRVTAHPQVRALCQAYGGAIVSTSANRSGEKPARTVFAVRRAFGDSLDYVLPGAVGSRPRPSVIRDARTGAVLRA